MKQENEYKKRIEEFLNSIDPDGPHLVDPEGTAYFLVSLENLAILATHKEEE